VEATASSQVLAPVAQAAPQGASAEANPSSGRLPGTPLEIGPNGHRVSAFISVKIFFIIFFKGLDHFLVTSNLAISYAMLTT